MLIVAAIVLISPWYQVTLSTQIPQTNAHMTEVALLTSNYESSYETQTNFGQPQIVFSMQGSVNLPGACMFSCWVSQSFFLQSGSVIEVDVTQCQSCLLTIDNTNGSLNAAIIQLGLFPNLNNTVRVVDSGNYVVTLGNLGDFAGTVTSISVSVIASTKIVPQITEVVQTTMVLSTTFSTTTVTQYSQTMVPPYTAIGVVALTAILVLLALLLVLSILLDRGIIIVSANRRKKRKR